VRNPTAVLAVIALGLVLAACGSSGAPAPAITPDRTGTPRTIPALREWQTGTGMFQFTGTSRIIIAAADEAELRPVAEVFAEDLLAQNGTAPAVLSDTTPASAGDISLSLGESDPRVGTEGYRMTVGPVLEIKAALDMGPFLRLLRWLKRLTKRTLRN